MIGLAILDFGGPQGPDELQPFLSNLLEDVLPGPATLKRIVAPWIATMRAKKVGPDYASIGWSPLVKTHYSQVAALKAQLGEDLPPVVVSGMMFTPPTMEEAARKLKDAGVTQIIALPMFPHYSIATTNTAFEFFFEAMKQVGAADIPVRWIPAFHDHPLYLQALTATILEGLANTPGPADEPIHLLFTPHGLPVSFVQRGDPYPDHIRASVRAVLGHLDYPVDHAHVGWQSRVGPVQWLEPSTPDTLDRLAAQGVKRVCMVPISFAAEHIETLFEIDVEYKEHAHNAGIPHFGRAPALGNNESFISCLADLVLEAKGDLEGYHCVRCLLRKPDVHRRKPNCVNCKFNTPTYLRESNTL